jgi:uncharacterized membrane protein
MDNRTERLIDRWRSAGLIDDASAERIRAWESLQPDGHASRFGRFVFGFGGLLLGAGVLLFVAANWPMVSPWGRFTLLAASIAGLHAAGAITRSRSEALAMTLHAVGTAALGGGIFLAGQVFNLAEHWPEGFLLWAAGAAVALWLLRDWPQAVWLAALAPAWLISEWITTELFGPVRPGVLLAAVFVLALAYVAAVGPDRDATWRRGVALLGALALLPAAVLLPLEPGPRPGSGTGSATLSVVGWMVALAVPFAVGFVLKGRAAWPLLLGAVLALVVVHLDLGERRELIVVHLSYAAAAAGLVWWGVHDGHRLRINVGVLGFALNVLAFYYGSLLDKFGRSLGLIGLGVLFIGGGWLVERTRRQLVERAGLRP